VKHTCRFEQKGKSISCSGAQKKAGNPIFSIQGACMAGMTKDEIQKYLTGLESGIQVDKKHLLSDMCSQFSNPREWVREYVVNAYDANAKICRISGCFG